MTVAAIHLLQPKTALVILPVEETVLKDSLVLGWCVELVIHSTYFCKG
jgi:hypothetical protein